MMLDYSDILPTPPPLYSKDLDKVIAFVTPRYTPLDEALPTIEVELTETLLQAAQRSSASSATSAAMPNNVKTLPYRVFAKALLEGNVVAKLKSNKD